MFTPTMTIEELYNEAISEGYAISTQVNMFTDNVRKKFHRSHGMIGYCRKTIKTKRNNEWMVFLFTFQNKLKNVIYAPIINGNNNDGYIVLNLQTYKHIHVIHYTSHFMKRLNERYIKRYDIKIPSGLSLIEYFTTQSEAAIYTKKEDGNGYYMISEQGLYIADKSIDNMMSCITFLGDDELNLKKQIVHDKQVKNFQVFIYLKRLLSSKDFIDFFTLYDAVRKYNADVETIKFWYRMMNISIPDKVIDFFYSTLKDNNISSMDELDKLLTDDDDYYCELMYILYKEYGDNYKCISLSPLGFSLRPKPFDF